MLPRSRAVTFLTTTSTFVITIAVVLAWWMKKADPKDLMIRTAAYAAVLAVVLRTGTTASTLIVEVLANSVVFLQRFDEKEVAYEDLVDAEIKCMQHIKY